MAGFCLTCIKITSYAGVFLFILFGIFTFAGFKYFKMMSEELSKGPFKSTKDKLGTEFFLASGVYLGISVLLYFVTKEPGEKKIVQTPEEEQRLNSIRETIRTYSSGEIVDQIIRDNKIKEPAEGALFPDDKEEEENSYKKTPDETQGNFNQQTPNLLEEQITNKNEEPSVNPSNEKLMNDVGPILEEESKQEPENNGAKDEVPLISNEENQS